MRKFSLRLAGATLAASIASVPVSAIAAPTITAPRPVDQFAVLSPIDGPRLSPNGKLLAAKVAVRGEPYLMIIPMDGGAATLRPAGQSAGPPDGPVAPLPLFALGR